MIAIENIVGEISKDFKQGSTRLVYFPTNKKQIILDGHKTKIQTVLKVAKSHILESNTGNCDLGKLQNNIESNLSKSKYSLFVLNSDNTYNTNCNGIIAPIINFDDNNNWVEMVKVINPMTIAIFNEFTGGEGFPAGLFYPDVELSLKKYYSYLIQKEGEIHPKYIDDDKYNRIIQHPWIKTYLSFMQEFNIVPYDFTLKNLGYIVHPITYKKFMVICDYGYTEEYENFFEFIEKSA